MVEPNTKVFKLSAIKFKNWSKCRTEQLWKNICLGIHFPFTSLSGPTIETSKCFSKKEEWERGREELLRVSIPLKGALLHGASLMVHPSGRGGFAGILQLSHHPSTLGRIAVSALCSEKEFENLLRELDSKGVWSLGVSYQGSLASLGPDEANARTEEHPWRRLPTSFSPPVPLQVSVWSPSNIYVTSGSIEILRKS